MQFSFLYFFILSIYLTVYLFVKSMCYTGTYLEDKSVQVLWDSVIIKICFYLWVHDVNNYLQSGWFVL